MGVGREGGSGAPLGLTPYGSPLCGPTAGFRGRALSCPAHTFHFSGSGLRAWVQWAVKVRLAPRGPGTARPPASAELPGTP